MELEQAREVLQNARRLAILTGAGISAESGIATFREAQTGLWARYKPEDLATPAAYQRDPLLVWQWYAERYQMVQKAQPNSAHLALVELERRQLSAGGSFVLVTQNVDGLHSRAGSGQHGGQYIELHGNLSTGRDEITGAIENLPPTDKIGQNLPPHSTAGNRLRPNVVWFGEQLSGAALTKAREAFVWADLALVIGTSGLVYPAAGLASQTLQNGNYLIEINPQETELSERVSLSLRQTASAGLAMLLG